MADLAGKHCEAAHEESCNAGFVPAGPSSAGKVESIGPYTLIRTLGVGSTGYVKLGIHNETKQRVAVKIIPKNNVCNGQPINLTKKLEREIAIMKLMKHPYVMSLFETFETEKEFYLILEYVEGGELFEYLVQRGRLEEFEACQIFQKIIFGLDYCHKYQICHRDLKPENLLLDKDYNIKIADFGMASLQKKGKFLETSCGSPHYASPEIVRGTKYDGLLSDIWSCGVILYALLSGNLPFDDENIRRLLSKVKAGKYQMPTHISEEAKDLLNRMMQVDPSHRIKMHEIIRHPWFNLAPIGTTPQVSILKTTGKKAEPIKQVDTDILKCMMSLGWTDRDQLLKALRSSKGNHEKTFYRLYYERQQGLECQCTQEKVCETCVERIAQGIVSAEKKPSEQGYAFGLKFLQKRFFGSCTVTASTTTSAPKETPIPTVNLLPQATEVHVSEESLSAPPEVSSASPASPVAGSHPLPAQASSSTCTPAQTKMANLISFFCRKRNGKTHPMQQKESGFHSSSNANSRSSTTMNNSTTTNDAGKDSQNQQVPLCASASSSKCVNEDVPHEAASSSSLLNTPESEQPRLPSSASPRPSSAASLRKKCVMFLKSLKPKPNHLKLYSPLGPFEVMFATRAILQHENVTFHDKRDGTSKCVFEVQDMVKAGFVDAEHQKDVKPLIFKMEMYRKEDDIVVRFGLKQGKYEVLEGLAHKILEQGVCNLSPI